MQDCDRRAVARGWCKRHYKRWQDTGAPDTPITRGQGSINSNGYRMIYVDGKPQGEHRVLMARHLGRALLPDETVHHRNGARAQNDLANLELWSSRHPKGQRVEDLLAYAREIIDLYGNVKLP